MKAQGETTCPCGSVVYSYGHFTITWHGQSSDDFYWRECAMCGAFTYHNAETHTQVTREEVLP